MSIFLINNWTFVLMKKETATVCTELGSELKFEYTMTGYAGLKNLSEDDQCSQYGSCRSPLLGALHIQEDLPPLFSFQTWDKIANILMGLLGESVPYSFSKCRTNSNGFWFASNFVQCPPLCFYLFSIIFFNSNFSFLPDSLSRTAIPLLVDHQEPLSRVCSIFQRPVILQLI